MLQKMKEKRQVVDVVFIITLAFILFLPMLNSQIDIYWDDGSQHLMRAYYTYQTMLENGSGNIIAAFTNGFGYSWNLFYGPLSSDIVMGLGVLLRSFNAGFKMALFLILSLAGLTMYQLVREMTDNANTACLASLIYMTSPYFFTDLYSRHAIGESMAFVFIPMIFLGLYNLFNTEKNHYVLIFGAVRIDFVP